MTTPAFDFEPDVFLSVERFALEIFSIVNIYLMVCARISMVSHRYNLAVSEWYLDGWYVGWYVGNVWQCLSWRRWLLLSPWAVPFRAIYMCSKGFPARKFVRVHDLCSVVLRVCMYVPSHLCIYVSMVCISIYICTCLNRGC